MIVLHYDSTKKVSCLYQTCASRAVSAHQAPSPVLEDVRDRVGLGLTLGFHVDMAVRGEVGMTGVEEARTMVEVDSHEWSEVTGEEGRA